jgi:hypothetical protein
VRRRKGIEWWLKPLAGHAVAVLVLNRSGRTRSVKLRLSKLEGLPAAGSYAAKDLWSGERSTVSAGGALRATLPRHAVVMWRLRRAH